MANRRAVPSLIRVVENFDNALDVRFAAAQALDRLGDASDLPQLLRLAGQYPEVSTRQALLATCARLDPASRSGGRANPQEYAPSSRPASMKAR